MTHDLWMNLNACIFEYLSSVKLSQLVASQQVSNVSVMLDKRGSLKSKIDNLLVA